MEQIAPDTYIATNDPFVVTGAIYTTDGWMLIDPPPLSFSANSLRRELDEIASNLPVGFVINTDYHPSRAVGSGWFDAPVIAHQAATENILSAGSNYLVQAAEALGASELEEKATSLKLNPPQISFSEQLSLSAGTHRIELLSAPGPSAGSIWVMHKEQSVIFTGGTVVTNHHPVIVKSFSKEWLGSLTNLRRDRFSDWIIVTGREGVITPEDTEHTSEYLRVARRRIFSLLRNDEPRAEVSKLVPEFLEFFSYSEAQQNVIQQTVKTGLEAIYDELRALAELEEATETVDNA